MKVRGRIASVDAQDKIPVWSYLREYAELREEILGAVDTVFASGRLILGAHVEQFEAEMSAVASVGQGVGVNSGTDALMIALMALGIGEGDEVITVANTAVPTVSAIVSVGARPVFVDVRVEDALIDPTLIEPAITPRTRAIIPVHLYGQCCDMEAIMAIADSHGLKVIEDCAQSIGALWRGRPSGGFGDACAFSFYPTKVLGAYGDAGWVGFRAPEHATLAKSLRMYGMEGSYYAHRHGVNSRLDEVQAAILSLKLTRLNEWVDRRRAIAARYNERLAGLRLALPRQTEGSRHCYYVYAVEHADRDRVMEALKAQGILCNISYPFPIHTMAAYAHFGGKDGDLPVTEAKATRVFSLPIFPMLTDDEVERVCDALCAVA